MKNKKLNASRIWKHFEDFLVPRLRLNIVDRAVYSHLLRHSRLEGRPRLRFSIAWLARGARLTTNPVRCPTRLLRQQFLSQPRLLLFAVQLAEKRSPRRRFPPQPLPRAPPDRRRTYRPPPRPRRPRLR